MVASSAVTARERTCRGRPPMGLRFGSVLRHKCDLSGHRSHVSRDIVPRSAHRLVVPAGAGIQGQLWQQFSVRSRSGPRGPRSPSEGSCSRGLRNSPRSAPSGSASFGPEPQCEGSELDGDSDRPRGHADVVPGGVSVRGQNGPGDHRHPGHEGERLHPKRRVAGARCLRGPREPFPYFSPDGRSRTVPPPTQRRQAPRSPPKPPLSGASTLSNHWGIRPQRSPHLPVVQARLRPALHQRC